MTGNYKNTNPDKRNTEGEPDSGHGNEHDSMFGMLLTESLFGGALGDVFAEAIDAPEWTSELDVGNAMDAYEEYRRDRTNGGFRLGVSGDLYGAFNRFGLHDSHDMPGNAENNDIIDDIPAVPAMIAMVHGQGSMVTSSFATGPAL